MSDFNLAPETMRALFGFAGSLVSLKFVPGDGWRSKLFNLLSGWAISYACSPLVGEWLHLSTESSRGGAAFLTGLLGVSVAAATLKGIASLDLAKSISSWITKGPQ